jgi:dUTP pyrophosphatase
VRVTLKRLDPGLPLPCYAHEGDAGLDLYSAVNVDIAPGQRILVPTGVAIGIPDGFAGFVQPRSGLALRAGISFVNTPGLIDSHYRGEIKVIAVNLDPSATISIARGDKIAQLVVQRVERVEIVEVDELDPTVRGEGGFGSTGV